MAADDKPVQASELKAALAPQFYLSPEIFAADMEVSLEQLLELGSASAIGGFAGWACQALNRRWAGA